jgi:hypothetical protein
MHNRLFPMQATAPVHALYYHTAKPLTPAVEGQPTTFISEI